MEDIEYLRNRDGAEFMKQASIDRINPLGNYCLDNCRFIEMSENRSKRIKSEMFKSLYGMSIKEISLRLKISKTAVYKRHHNSSLKSFLKESENKACYLNLRGLDYKHEQEIK